MQKFLKVLGIILLIIIILFAVLIGVLYFANKSMNPANDNVDELLMAEPLSAKERLSFSAQDETMTILLNKNDLYWLITNEYGNSYLDSIVEEAEDNGIVIDGFGMEIKPEGIYIDIVAAPKEYDGLKLNVSILCDLERNGNQFDLVPSSVIALGKEITQLESTDIFDEPIISFNYTPSLLDDIDSYELVDGGIKIAGKMSVRYCGMAREGFTGNQLAKMTEDERCNYSSKILLKYIESPDEGKKLWMSILEEDPGLFPIVYKQMLSMIKKSGWANYYVELDNYGFIYRVYPEYDVNVFKDISDDLHAEYA